MDIPSQLAELADRVDSARAAELRADHPSELAVVLATAYPALEPRADWQRAAIAELAESPLAAPRRRADYLAQLFGDVDGLSEREQVMRSLRRIAWRERARIALRELLPHSLGGAVVEETCRELSELASATLEVALAEAEAALGQRFGAPVADTGLRSTMVVMGMGKLGGHELNAGSDIDLMFFYDTDRGGSELTLHDHWSRVAQRLVQNIDEVTDDGQVWRVDLRLRPEGSQGPLVNSISAAERYYATWGRLWERAAMIRARAVAGDLDLGRTLMREVLGPFTYRRKVDPGIAGELAKLTVRAREELSSHPDRDLKLGLGGIRECEFFVQALQLIWGGQEPSVRVRELGMALDRLKSCGLATDLEAREIRESYWLLRRTEHTVQWQTGLQTHSLPEAEASVDHVARAVGFADAAELQRALGEARGRVHRHFDSLAPDAPSSLGEYAAILARLELGGRALDVAATEIFGTADLGDHLAALARRPDSLLGGLTRERWPHLADGVLTALRGAADAELAARSLRAFFSRFATASAYVSPLAVKPRALERMVSVLGASAFVGDALVAHPELFDLLLGSASSVTPDDMARLVAEETFHIDRSDGEAVLAGLRRAKTRGMVEVAIADLAGQIGTRDATESLSALAECVLTVATERVLRGPSEVEQPVRGLAVIAMGKLGGRELGYGSDLDVLFIYDPEAASEGCDAREYFTRAAQRVISLISLPHAAGPGYELDTRLRPSGSHGLLVTSVGAFARYHGVASGSGRASQPSVLSSGAAWERQALLRARWCAGDEALGQRVIELAALAAYECGAPPAAEMHRLRMRMQMELGQERPFRFDLKVGRGGLLDVEFAVQRLQMLHGSDHSVRTTDTGDAIEALRDGGYLGEESADVLRDGYRFLRRLEQRIHVRRGRGDNRLDRHMPGLPQLARRMGLTDTSKGSAEDLLLERYADTTASLRREYLSILGVDGD